ncbi:MAG: hypothetical protein H6673_15630 [Anaerolineales bacterium]|nr:hypothetical protein [Anaerolineales bacterium]
MEKSLLLSDVTASLDKLSIKLSRFEHLVISPQSVFLWEIDIQGSAAYKHVANLKIEFSFTHPEFGLYEITDMAPFQVGTFQTRRKLRETIEISEIADFSDNQFRLRTTHSSKTLVWQIYDVDISEKKGFVLKLKGLFSATLRGINNTEFKSIFPICKATAIFSPQDKENSETLLELETEDPQSVFSPIALSIEHGSPVSAPPIEAFCSQFGWRDERYLKLDKLYVKPSQFQLIRDTLLAEHMICLIGDPGMGKSYSALYLVYQLFVEGYLPEIPQELEMDEFLLNVGKNPDSVFQGKKVIFVEDPFGKTDFRRRDIFTTNLQQIAASVKKSDSMLIITSRVGLFDKALANQMLRSWLKKVTINLTLGTLTYHLDDMDAIAANYTAIYQPLWAKDEATKVKVFALAKENLTAPQSMEFFIHNYADTDDISKLTQAIQNSKQDQLVNTISEHILQLPYFEQIFFVLIGMFQLTKNNLRYIYEKELSGKASVSSNLRIPTNAWQICEIRYGDKLTSHESYGISYLHFYHPHLFEAVKQALEDDLVVYNQYIELIELIKKDSNPFGIRAVAKAILHRFPNQITQTETEILEELMVHPDFLVRSGLPTSIADAWLNSESRDKLEAWLKRLANDKHNWVCRNVALNIARLGDINLQKESAQGLLEIFDQLSKHQDYAVRYGVGEAVIWHFEDVLHLRQYLWAMQDDADEVAQGLFADSLVWQFQRLEPQDQVIASLDKFLRSDQPTSIQGWAISALAWHQDSLVRARLPKDLFEKYLDMIGSETRQEAFKSSAQNLAWHYDYFAWYKPEFVGMLSSSESIKGSEESGIIQTLFPKSEDLNYSFPQQVQQYFFRMAESEDEYVRAWSSFAFTARIWAFGDIATLGYDKALDAIHSLSRDKVDIVRTTLGRCLIANFERHKQVFGDILTSIVQNSNSSIKSFLKKEINSLESEIPVHERAKYDKL